jgi:hypothetical protein
MGYNPGGPWLIRSCEHNSEQHPCKICAENRQEYNDWHEGFLMGKAFQPEKSTK